MVESRGAPPARWRFELDLVREWDWSPEASALDPQQLFVEPEPAAGSALCCPSLDGGGSRTSDGFRFADFGGDFCLLRRIEEEEEVHVLERSKVPQSLAMKQ